MLIRLGFCNDRHDLLVTFCLSLSKEDEGEQCSEQQSGNQTADTRACQCSFIHVPPTTQKASGRCGRLDVGTCGDPASIRACGWWFGSRRVWLNHECTSRHGQCQNVILCPRKTFVLY